MVISLNIFFGKKSLNDRKMSKSNLLKYFLQQSQNAIRKCLKKISQYYRGILNIFCRMLKKFPTIEKPRFNRKYLK